MTTLYVTPPGGMACAVDLTDDLPISLHYSTADVREPDKRTAAYSQTIALPGTAANNKLFNHIFEIDSTGTYNPNKKAAAALYVDTLPVFSGYIQLTKITTTNRNTIAYEVNLLGNTADFFHALQQVNTSTNNPLYLQDLALDGSLGNSATNCAHHKNTQNVATSWGNTSKYVYPLLDFGTLECSSISGGHYALNAKNAIPCVFAKTVLDEIFYEAGTNTGLPAGTYSYKSDFLNTAPFTKLIIPLEGGLKRQAAYSVVFGYTVDAYTSFSFTIYKQDYISGALWAIQTTGLNNTGNSSSVSNTAALNGTVSLNYGDQLVCYASVSAGATFTVNAGATFAVSYTPTDKLGIDGSFTAQSSAAQTFAYYTNIAFVFDT